MAQTPRPPHRPTTTPPPVKPFPSAPPTQAPAIPSAPPAASQGMNVNIHGVEQGPRPNMAPSSSKRFVHPAIQAEMDAGAKALDTYSARTNAELEYGRKAIEPHNPPPDDNDEDEDDDK